MKLRGTRLFSSSILIFFQYACRTVRPDFLRLPLGIYIDKHDCVYSAIIVIMFEEILLRKTYVLHCHSNKIYHHLKDTLRYCLIPNLIALIYFCT